ncbi:hypothetical protein PG994_009508 [Apiospora phragmitis]|uniref:Uncharacterized protein n=1 Tax=Apiospora phragmitis TaxID=2905665 RepID=A0ABR1U8F2_9PEZI
MPGFLVPDRYKPHDSSVDDLMIISIIWGITIAAGLFTASKAYKQSKAMYKRTGQLSIYTIMIWAEWTASMTIGVLCWCHIRGYIEPSFWIYFFILTFWTIQIQCICQIIINRIGLLALDQKRMRKIRWGVFGILAMVNISVYCIWIPARLQISDEYIFINKIWDRLEKVIFLIVDSSLSIYFVVLIRRNLIDNGLTKYMPLYRFNLFMVGCSIALDVILIVSMSIPNDILTDLATSNSTLLVYMMKLHIEMNIASLIAKVVRATGGGNSDGLGNNKSSSLSRSQGTELKSTSKRRATNLFSSSSNHRRLDNNDGTRSRGKDARVLGLSGHHQFTASTGDGARDEDFSAAGHERQIKKVTQTTVTVSHANDRHDEDAQSESSTSYLKHDEYDSPV